MKTVRVWDSPGLDTNSFQKTSSALSINTVSTVGALVDKDFMHLSMRPMVFIWAFIVLPISFRSIPEKNAQQLTNSSYSFTNFEF